MGEAFGQPNQQSLLKGRKGLSTPDAGGTSLDTLDGPRSNAQLSTHESA
jgi:hypothetical protein